MQQVCIEQIGFCWTERKKKNAAHHLSVFAASEAKMLSGHAISHIGMQEIGEPSDTGREMHDAAYIQK